MARWFVLLVVLGIGSLACGDEGDSDESASHFLTTEAGRGVLAWFAAVEVTLAYGTDDEPIDGDKLIDLLDAFFDDAMEAWAELASERALARARIIVNNWTDALCPAITALAGQVQAVADIVRGCLHTNDSDVESLKAEAQAIAVYSDSDAGALNWARTLSCFDIILTGDPIFSWLEEVLNLYSSQFKRPQEVPVA